MRCIFRGRRSTLQTSDILLRGRHSTFNVSCCAFLADPHFTLYTPHFTLHLPHFTFHTILHFTHLYTPHFTLHNWHFTLYTPHFTLHTLHSTLYTLHSTLHIFYYMLYTLHSTLYIPCLFSHDYDSGVRYPTCGHSGSWASSCFFSRNPLLLKIAEEKPSMQVIQLFRRLFLDVFFRGAPPDSGQAAVIHGCWRTTCGNGSSWPSKTWVKAFAWLFLHSYSQSPQYFKKSRDHMLCYHGEKHYICIYIKK